MATGTSGAIYSNRECLFRLQTLIIDGGTEVLRNLFDQRLHGVALGVVLSQEKKIINMLKRQKTITKAQNDLLYPPSGQLPTCQDFDITLIICLLRNLPALGCNQNYTWNVPPQPADVSVEADLCRLRAFRNEIAHISSTSGFKQVTFLVKWTEVEKVFLRLNTAVRCPLPNFKQTIDSYKDIPLDAATEQRNQTIIQQWREMERGLETEILLIKGDMQSIFKDVRDMKQGVANIEQDVRKTKQGVANIEQDVRKTKQGVANIEQDVRKTKQGIENMEQNEIDTRQNLSGIKGDVHVINQKLDVIEKDIKSINAGEQSEEERVRDYAKRRSNLRNDLISFYARTSAGTNASRYLR